MMKMKKYVKNSRKEVIMDTTKKLQLITIITICKWIWAYDAFYYIFRQQK